MDIANMTDEELDALYAQVTIERNARIVLQNAEKRAADLTRAAFVARARNLGDGEHLQWERPTGAHNAYPINCEVEHGGIVYVSTMDSNFLEPGLDLSLIHI